MIRGLSKISIASLVAVSVLAMTGIASAAVIGSVTVNPGTINQNQSTNILGTCGTAGANGAVNVVVTSGSSSMTSTTTANASGAFSVGPSVSTSFPTGTATVVATCPNGDTVTGSFTVNTANPNVTLEVQNDNPAVGNEIRFFGDCGDTSGQQVTVSLASSNGTSTVIGRVLTEANGTFSATLTIPDTISTGNGQLRATCPNGQTAAVAVTLVPDGRDNTPTPTPSPTPTPTGTTGDAGDVGGTNEDTTPEGGVQAGDGSAAANTGAMMALTLGSVIALYAVARKLMYR
jgi:hypothetical protein